MARKSGKSLLIKTGGTPTTIVLQTECTLTYTRDPIATTTKDDDINTYVAGTGDWTVEGACVLDVTEATHDGIYTDIDTSASQSIAVAVDTETYSGSAFCTNWSVEGGNDSPITLSFSYQGSGDLTKA